ncbi:ABC transporter permease [Planctomicrobium sp. SH664]|uniref:ABC transporter permease n=1 Tax=Planctomicrobium sp. SH664 TaxID=3448125 RepID=UPI003F5B720D
MYKFLLANRYLRTRFIALASVISVTLGVATMIVVNSVMSGFSSQMRDRIHGILSDMVVESQSMDGTPFPDQIIADIERVAGQYIEAITPTVEIYGMMSFQAFGQHVNRPVTIIGIVPDTKEQVSPLSSYLLNRQEIKEDGELIRPPLIPANTPLDWSLTSEALAVRENWMRLQRFQELDSRYQAARNATTESPLVDDQDPFATAPPPAHGGVPAAPQDPNAPMRARLFVGAGVISHPTRDDKGKFRTFHYACPGQDVVLTTIKTGNPQPVSFKATIVDVFKSGMSEYDSNLVFCNLEELQLARGMLAAPDPTRPHDNLNWRNGAVTSLQIKLKNFDDAPEVARRLRGILPLDLMIRTWEEKQGPLLQAVAVESAILNVLLFLIITVAGFGILAIFYMIVVEKTRDIGILKALGASSQGVMSIFLAYGLSLGIVGSGAGVVLGLLFIRYINQIESVISWMTGQKVFDEAIYYFHEIPTSISPTMVVSVAAGAMLIAILASVLPARRAASLHPVRALRYE